MKKLDKPYYVAIFTSKRSKVEDGYEEMSEYLDTLVKEQKGFLGQESIRDANGFGITVSYWESEEDIFAWKNNYAHIEAKKLGQKKWYTHYEVKIAQVNYAYGKKI